jgi:hypothetical protein
MTVFADAPPAISQEPEFCICAKLIDDFVLWQDAQALQQLVEENGELFCLFRFSRTDSANGEYFRSHFIKQRGISKLYHLQHVAGGSFWEKILLRLARDGKVSHQ